jgi:AcrR family transcriptional regulator
MSRLKPQARAEVILIAAMRIARRPGGWASLTRARIASEARCADSLVTLRLGSMDAIRQTLMKRAIKHEYFDLIAQGLAAGDPSARALSPILKHKAVATMVD